MTVPTSHPVEASAPTTSPHHRGLLATVGPQEGRSQERLKVAGHQHRLVASLLPCPRTPAKLSPLQAPPEATEAKSHRAASTRGLDLIPSTLGPGRTGPWARGHVAAR